MYGIYQFYFFPESDMYSFSQKLIKYMESKCYNLPKQQSVKSGFLVKLLLYKVILPIL